MKTNIFCITMVLITMLCITVFPQTVSAQASTKIEKQLQKQRNKEYKVKLKEYKKGGWKMAGSSRSLEVALLEHQIKLTEGNTEIVGEVSQCKSVNICKQSALNNAQNEYARLISGKIQGAFGSIIKANANRPQEEIDKMAGGLLNEIEANVGGILIPSYSIVKENTNGTKSFRTFFIISESETLKILDTSLERSIKETKLTIEEARSISKFVQEELKKEE